MKVPNIVVRGTYDYKKFKFVKENREVSRDTVRRYAKSYSNDPDPIVMITVNENMEIIDGQHSLKAAELLKYPVYYLVKRNKDKKSLLDQIRLTNANQQGWAARQFLDFYIKQGNKEYIAFKKFMQDNNLTFTIALFLLSYPEFNKSHGHHYVFKNGSFTITDLEKSQKNSDKINEILKYAHRSLYTSIRFMKLLDYL